MPGFEDGAFGPTGKFSIYVDVTLVQNPTSSPCYMTPLQVTLPHHLRVSHAPLKVHLCSVLVATQWDVTQVISHTTRRLDFRAHWVYRLCTVLGLSTRFLLCQTEDLVVNRVPAHK